MSHSLYSISPHNQPYQPPPQHPPQHPPPVQPALSAQECGARVVSDVVDPLPNNNDEIINVSQNNPSCMFGSMNMQDNSHTSGVNITESSIRSSCKLEPQESGEPQNYVTQSSPRLHCIREKEPPDAELAPVTTELGPLPTELTPLPSLLTHNIPSIMNLNQSSPRPHDDEIYHENEENRPSTNNISHPPSNNPDSYMFPGTQPQYYLPPFHQNYHQSNIIRPTVLKPHNNHMYFPSPWSSFFRYPGFPPFPNFMMPNQMFLDSFPPKEQNEVISVPSDEEQKEDDIISVEENIDIEENNDAPEATTKVEINKGQKLKKERPVDKVQHFRKVANQKCNKCDFIFVKGPQLFCHILKVHKKDKSHACKHCGYCCLKRSRTVSRSSSASTMSVRTPTPDRSPKSQPSSLSSGPDVQPTKSQPPSQNLEQPKEPVKINKKKRIKGGKRNREKKQKTDLHIPSPKTLQNSLNKIFE